MCPHLPPTEIIFIQFSDCANKHFLKRNTFSIHRKEFFDAYINYAFNQSVEPVFEEFKRGFFKVCIREVVEFFEPKELRSLMVGQEFTDWNVMKQVCTTSHNKSHTILLREEIIISAYGRFLTFLSFKCLFYCFHENAYSFFAILYIHMKSLSKNEKGKVP